MVKEFERIYISLCRSAELKCHGKLFCLLPVFRFQSKYFLLMVLSPFSQRLYYMVSVYQDQHRSKTCTCFVSSQVAYQLVLKNPHNLTHSKLNGRSFVKELTNLTIDLPTESVAFDETAFKIQNFLTKQFNATSGLFEVRTYRL